MNNRFLTSAFVLMNADEVRLNKSWKYQNVTSSFYRLYYIEDGKGVLSNSDGHVVLEKGYLYLLPSFTKCNYSCSSFLKQFYVTFVEETPDGSSLFFANRRIFKIPASKDDVVSIKRLLCLNPDRGLRLSYNPDVYEKTSVLRSYREANNHLRLCDFLETCGILMQLVARFMASQNFLERRATVIPTRVADAVHFIQTHLQAPITVSQLARRAHQNPDYFSRIFHAHTGERPLTYIQNKRIERAQLLLATTDKPFSDIAMECGFDSLPYFARIFKRRTGLTAGNYKKMNHYRMPPAS